MSTRTISNYRLFCNTENKFVTVWSENKPIVCPNNIQDQVDINSISIVDSVSSNSVNIIQYSSGIQGLYRAQSKSLFIPARQTVSEDIVFDIPISMISMNFTTTKQNTGDLINCYISPNTKIGVITSNINNGDKTINVSTSVIKYIKRGYIVTITNGTTILNMGECININSVTNTIICNIPSNTSIISGSLVEMTVHNIKDFLIGPPSSITFNNKTLETTLIPANTIMRFIYQNNSNIDTIFFKYIEYLY